MSSRLDAVGVPFKALDEHPRRIALAFTLTLVFALLSPVIAAAQTVCRGSVSAWWVVAGLFLWILVVLSVLLGLARLQRKAESKGEAKGPPGGMEVRRA